MKKRIVAALFLCIMLLTFLTSCGEEVDYNERIINLAQSETEKMGFCEEDNPFSDGTRYFEVTENPENRFSVNVNGTQMYIQQVPSEDEEEYEPKYISDISAKTRKILVTSRELIKKYIESSSFFVEKDEIKKYIESLKVKEALFTNEVGVGAYFSYSDDTLYINRKYTSSACEWMIVHEMVHALSFYTHGCDIECEEYAFSLFNEVMTDLITSSMNPKIPEDILSGYFDYYFLVFPYINRMGAKAIEAYFYGYEDIYESLTRDEFRFYVDVIENCDKINSDVYYNNLMLKWNSKVRQ